MFLSTLFRAAEKPQFSVSGARIESWRVPIASRRKPRFEASFSMSTPLLRSEALGNLAGLEFDNLERFGIYTRLHFEGRSYTNLEELRLAGSWARLLEDFGVRRDDRVLVMMPNSPELTAAFPGIWMLGAAIVPVIPQWTAGEVADILRNSDASVVDHGAAPGREAASRRRGGGDGAASAGSGRIGGRQRRQHRAAARPGAPARDAGQSVGGRHGGPSVYVGNHRDSQRRDADARQL